MSAHSGSFEVRTKGRGLYDVTDQVKAIVAAAKVDAGMVVVFVKHTSASLTIQENADPAVLRDLEAWIARAAPESDVYEHDAEGADDMPAHIRTVLTRTSETIPIAAGAMTLGTWQAIYLWEHRRRPHTRTLAVHVQGA